MDLREAAEALGVHYQTAYAWVREGTLPARKVGRGYEVGDAGVQALAARRRQGHEPPRPIHVRDWAAQAQALYAAITGGEETRARHQVERLASGVRVVDLCEQVIAPALRRVGDEWAAGRVSIAQEHRASAICERLLASHIRQPAGRPRGTAVVTTPPGERHGLPALMAAACLREDRWLVHHLASDLPVAEVARLADQVGAGLVVFSSAMSQTARQAQQAARAITATRPRLTVLAGGPGDSLQDLLAWAGHPPAAGQGPRA
ncbi:MAG TPA: B12-binding domain-containing protein [Streptosporangiaceae bacterium]|nr:B12-binding domain-containing protein [Streptosporangiaceae bacterium]